MPDKSSAIAEDALKRVALNRGAAKDRLTSSFIETATSWSRRGRSGAAGTNFLSNGCRQTSIVESRVDHHIGNHFAALRIRGVHLVERLHAFSGGSSVGHHADDADRGAAGRDRRVFATVQVVRAAAGVEKVQQRDGGGSVLRQ
jgi:hypothetical protein